MGGGSRVSSLLQAHTGLAESGGQTSGWWGSQAPISGWCGCSCLVGGGEGGGGLPPDDLPSQLLRTHLQDTAPRPLVTGWPWGCLASGDGEERQVGLLLTARLASPGLQVLHTLPASLSSSSLGLPLHV